MALTYSTYVTTIANMLVMDAADADFLQILPSGIDYAEQRMYRELDLLATVVRDSSSNVSANSRNFTLPQAQGRFVDVNGINIYTPVGTTTTRNQLTPVSRDVLDMIWPSDTAAAVTTVPQMFAMISDQTVIFGPPPGAAFTAEVIGTIRPTPLSSGNPTTYLVLYLPDIFVAATMVFMAGWQKNFGAQADDVRSAQSWETQYKELFASANIEEMRRKFASQGWTSEQPAPLAAIAR